MKKLLPIVCTISLGLLGCERPEKTVDTLRKDIAEFRAAPDDQKSAAIEKNLSKLDAEITKLRTQGNAEKANFLQEQKDSLASDFGAAKVYRTLQDAKSGVKGGASPTEESSPASETATPEMTPETATPQATPTPEATMPEATPEVSVPQSSPQADQAISPNPEASPIEAISPSAPEASPQQ